LLFAAVVVVEAVTEVPVARMQNLHNSDNERLYVQRYYITAVFTNIFVEWGRLLRSASALRVRGASRENKRGAFAQDGSALTRGVCFARGKWSSCARPPEQKPCGRVGCLLWSASALRVGAFADVDAYLKARLRPFLPITPGRNPGLH
jgi:hypothetical protein